MNYKVIYTEKAINDLKYLKRRINQEHRLVYRIYDDKIEVLIIAAYGHYQTR